MQKKDLGKPIKTILFVCTGNVCRSAMSEVMLRKMLNDNGITNVKIVSRGTAANPSYQVPEIIVGLMRSEGIDITSHRSRMLDEFIINLSDIILVMEEKHKKIILKYFKEAESKVWLLKEFVKENGYPEIDDPIGGPDEVYVACKTELRGYLSKLVEIIKANNGQF